jgi:hypothetical protein
MAIDYKDSIQFFDEQQDISNHMSYLQSLPDFCPVCTYSISPSYILMYDKDDFTSELLCGCPRNECGSLFIAEYRGNGHYFSLARCYPNNKLTKEFPDEISELSADFCEIYNQAQHAEQEGLDLICGVGYRKALEYLIKDYALEISPTDITKIQRMNLQQCVQKYITETTIKEMAERAVWLGNDETHYVRKWEGRDNQDLKNLIELTVFFLSMTMKAKKYIDIMN